MFNFIVAIFRVIFRLFSARKMNIIIKNAILKKENEILKRNNKKRIRFLFFDRLFYTILCQLSEKGKDFVSLIKPESVLRWQRELIKSFWTFLSNKPRIGRPAVPVQVKELILEMKNRNLYWGYKRIQGELLKLGIELDKKTSVKAPNMNAIAERFIGSVRREILDHFIIIGQHQLYHLLKAYIEYYNTRRPHQGIEQRVPKGYPIRTFGRIKSRPTLFGLNYDFYREAA